VARVDQLEYFYDLQTERGPKGLLGVLGERRNLLFLGCNFPEWLAGFFTRILIGRPFYQTRERGIEVIASGSSQGGAGSTSGLTAFLRANRMEVYPGNAAQFIDELLARYVPPSRRPSGEKETAAFGRRSPGTAFISYSRRDVALVRNLAAQLR